MCLVLPSVSPQWNHCSLAGAVGFNLQLFFVLLVFFLILRTIFILTPQRCEEQPDVPLSLLLLSRFSHVRLLWPYELQPARLLCPWDSPGKSTIVGCHFLLQGIFPTQGSNPGLLHCRQILYCWVTREALSWLPRYFGFFIWPCRVSVWGMWDLVTQLGIKLRAPAFGVRSLIHLIIRKVPS